MEFIPYAEAVQWAVAGSNGKESILLFFSNAEDTIDAYSGIEGCQGWSSQVGKLKFPGQIIDIQWNVGWAK